MPRCGGAWGQVNYNLLTVNAFMAVTGIYQLGRKLRLDYGDKLGLSPEAPVLKTPK